MTVQVLDADIPGAHRHAIARLSSELRLPIDEVAAAYRAQLERIGESARIHHYLSLLAAKNTRSALRN